MAHIDHINHDRLDNRKSNLRWATAGQNSANKESVTGTSGFKGVCWDKRREKWRAAIKHNQKQTHLGYFTDEVAAAEAYNAAALMFFGEFALINQLPPKTS